MPNTKEPKELENTANPKKLYLVCLKKQKDPFFQRRRYNPLTVHAPFLCGPIPGYTAPIICANLIFPRIFWCTDGLAVAYAPKRASSFVPVSFSRNGTWV